MIKRALLVTLAIIIMAVGGGLLWKYNRLHRPKQLSFDLNN